MDISKVKEGLTNKDAERLLAEFGPNSIESANSKSIISKIIQQLSSFLMILLIVATVLSFIIGEAVDGILIVTIIILNTAFGIYQEFKAEQAVAALRELTISTIRVIRGGKEQEIDSQKLVPGDLIMIEEGVKIPADAVVVQAHSLEVNEAALTGESIPVLKSTHEHIFMGTIVTKGRAHAVVSATGMKTQFGKIAEKLAAVEESETPLQKKLARVTEVIGIVGIVLSFIVFGLSAIEGNGIFPSFLLAISLAVAIVPESLPAVMTIILSIGVKKMAKRNAIIRRLAAIEALGSTTLIATDKTGTLTQNKMNVKYLYFNTETVAEKDIAKHSSSALTHIIQDGVLCSTASLVMVHDHGSFEVLGDPTEGALLMMAHDRGVRPDDLRRDWELIDEISFDSVKKRMSVMVQKDLKIVYSKGAPESILGISSDILIGDTIKPLDTKRRTEIDQVLQGWSKEGLRVLAFASKDVTNDASVFTKLKKQEREELSDDTMLQDGLVFLGMVAIHDPPRPEAKQAIATAHKAGISVVMITGDNEKTAEAIGASVGLLQDGDVIMTGSQIDEYSDAQLMEILPHTRIFARTTPFHKSRIVTLYQKLGEIVTVTGDGVNDAIALKQADVGVAMGRVGTDVAREVSDMVIMDDNFATIVHAIEEGRNIIIRLKKAVQYLLTGNASEGLTLVSGLILGLPPILLPIQLLYINLISDGIPALAMAFSPHDDQVMIKKHSSSSSILEKAEYQYIGTIGVIVTGLVLATYFLTGNDHAARQTAAFTMLALVQSGIFIEIWFTNGSKRKNIREYLSPLFLLTAFSPVLLQVLIVTTGWGSKLFELSQISLPQTMVFIVLSFSIIIFIRAYRLVRAFS